jgi:hypothetical protein
MALTNIFREPKRELIETVVGISLAAIPCAADYWFAAWLRARSLEYEPRNPIPLPIGMLFGLAIMAAFVVFMLIIHATGEVACNALERRGIHLRPRNR